MQIIIYVGWKSNKVLLCSIVDYIQYPVKNHYGKEYEKECVHTHITESFCYSVEINTTL